MQIAVLSDRIKFVGAGKFIIRKSSRRRILRISRAQLISGLPLTGLYNNFEIRKNAKSICRIVKVTHYRSSSNPVYQPIETPTNTYKYSNIFESSTPQTQQLIYSDLPIVTAVQDQVIEEKGDDRVSAEFGKHSRHVSLEYEPQT